MAQQFYTGHVLLALDLGLTLWRHHSAGPPTSGVFTLLPLITGVGRLHHGEILAQATAPAQATQATRHRSTSDSIRRDRMPRTFSLSGSIGKVVIGH